MSPPPIVAMATAGWTVLAAELGLVFLAAWAGGVSVAPLRLGHRRMQILLSFTGGILLGVAFLHLVPHAIAARGGAVDEVVPWMLAGFFLMFLLERAFRGHAHHAVDPEHGPAARPGPGPEPWPAWGSTASPTGRRWPPRPSRGAGRPASSPA